MRFTACGSLVWIVVCRHALARGRHGGFRRVCSRPAKHFYGETADENTRPLLEAIWTYKPEIALQPRLDHCFAASLAVGDWEAAFRRWARPVPLVWVLPVSMYA